MPAMNTQAAVLPVSSSRVHHRHCPRGGLQHPRTIMAAQKAVLFSRALHGKVARRDRHRDGGFYPDLDGDATLDTSTPQTLSRVKARSAIGFARPPRAEGASSAGSSPHAGTPTYSRARTAAPVEGGSFLQRRRKCVDALGYIPTLVSCLCSPPPRHRPAPGFGFHSCAPLIPHPVGRLGSGP